MAFTVLKNVTVKLEQLTGTTWKTLAGSFAATIREESNGTPAVKIEGKEAKVKAVVKSHNVISDQFRFAYKSKKVYAHRGGTPNSFLKIIEYECEATPVRAATQT